MSAAETGRERDPHVETEPSDNGPNNLSDCASLLENMQDLRSLVAILEHTEDNAALKAQAALRETVIQDVKRELSEHSQEIKRELSDHSQEIKRELSEQSDKVAQAVDDQIDKRTPAIEGMASAAVNQRVKMLTGVAGFIVAVLTFLGYQAVSGIIKDRISEGVEEETRTVLAENFSRLQRLDADLQVTGERLTRQLADARADFRISLIDETNKAMSEFDELLQKLQVKANLAEEEFDAYKDALREQEDAAKLSIQDYVDTQQEELETASTNARRALSAESADIQKTLDRVRDNALERITAAGRDARVNTKPADAAQAAPEDGGIDLEDQAFRQAIMAMQFVTERDFDEVSRIAVEARDSGEVNTQLANVIGTVLLFRPESFDDLDAALDVVFAPTVPELERASMVTEAIVTAALTGNEKIGRAALQEYEDNVFARLAQSPLFRFARGVYEEKPVDELERLWDDIDFAELSGTGYINTLALAKRAGLPEGLIAEAERRVLDALRETNTIDRPSDYALVNRLVPALLDPPRQDDDRIRHSLSEVIRFIFDEDHQADPWGLMARMNQFIEGQ